MYDSNEVFHNEYIDGRITLPIVATRTYRKNTWQYYVGFTLSIFGLAFLFAIWYGVLSGAREPKFLEMMFPVAYLLFAIIFTIRSFRSAVYLSDNSIEVRGLLGTKTLPLDKIEGRRRYVDQGHRGAPSVRHIVLEPNDDRFSRIDIEENFRFDDVFYLWFDELPDLDELDKHKPNPSHFGLI